MCVQNVLSLMAHWCRIPIVFPP